MRADCKSGDETWKAIEQALADNSQQLLELTAEASEKPGLVKPYTEMMAYCVLFAPAKLCV